MRTGALTALLLRLALVGGLLLVVGGSERAGAQPVRVGVRMGPSFGFLNDRALPFVSEPGVTEASTNVRLDLNAGVHVVVPLTDRWALQPELLFVRKGGHLSRSGDDLFTSERYRFSYLQVHLLGRRALSLPGPLSLQAVAGITGAVATGGAVQRDLQTTRRDAAERVDLFAYDLVHRWDVGALLGLGVDYPLGASRTVTLSLRYNPGVRTLFTSAQRPPDQQGPIGFEPPPLTRTPPPLRHDVLLVSIAYTWATGL